MDEFQREETSLWEKNESKVYTGQWLLCELDREFPTWLTIWPRERLDKLFSSKTIKTGNEVFDKRFNLSSDDEAAALRILTPGRIDGSLVLACIVYIRLILLFVDAVRNRPPAFHI